MRRCLLVSWNPAAMLPASLPARLTVQARAQAAAETAARHQHQAAARVAELEQELREVSQGQLQLL